MLNLENHKPANVHRLKQFEGSAERLLKDVAEYLPEVAMVLEVRNSQYQIWYTKMSRIKLVGMLETAKYEILSHSEEDHA